MGMIREGFETLGKRGKTAIAVLFALMMAWTVFVTVCQQAGFERYKQEEASKPETVTLMTQDGPVQVDKHDYDEAMRIWKDGR